MERGMGKASSRRVPRAPRGSQSASRARAIRNAPPCSGRPAPWRLGMDLLATSHFSDNALLRDAKHWVAQDSTTTAVLLSRIAEIDDRKLYLREGYPSLFGYCVHELRLSEDATYRRITAARAARRFPSILVALQEGRVHLAAVLMLAPYLTSANAEELLVAATHQTRPELEQLLAERFPRPDLPQRLEAIAALSAPTTMLVPPAPTPVDQLAPARVEAIIPD